MAKTPTEIKSLARAHTEEAIKCLVGVMRNSTNDSAKVAAAEKLMDRGWGKAETKSEVTVRKVAANELRDDELAAIAVGSGEGVDPAPVDPSQLN